MDAKTFQTLTKSLWDRRCAVILKACADAKCSMMDDHDDVAEKNLRDAVQELDNIESARKALMGTQGIANGT
jgi:hypothetical protein